MKILVGYTPTPERIAAFDFATGHPKLVDAIPVVCVPPKPIAG